MVQDHLLVMLHLYIGKKEGSPTVLPRKQASSIFQVAHFPVTELLSKRKNFTEFYFSVEKLKKPAYRKNMRVKNFQLQK